MDRLGLDTPPFGLDAPPFVLDAPPFGLDVPPFGLDALGLALDAHVLAFVFLCGDVLGLLPSLVVCWVKNENHGFGKLAGLNPHKYLQSDGGEVWEQKE